MITTPAVCKYCEEGNMVEETYNESFKVGRSALAVGGLRHSRCDACDSVMTNAHQYEHNMDLVRAAEKRSPGYVSPAMLREFREKYGVSQRQAGRLIGVGEGAFGKYETGSNLATPTAKLIRVALAIPEAAKMLAEEECIDIEILACEEEWHVGKFRYIAGAPASGNDELFDLGIINDWKKSEGLAA